FSLNMVLDGIMENANEKSASLSFVSSYQTCWSTNQSTGTCDLDNLNLRRQSSNPKETWLDAEIVVEGKSVAVNRSILSERSQFFRRLFNLRNDGSVSGGKPKYLLTDLVPYDGKFGFEAFNDILHYIYTGMNKESPPEVSTCVDDACAHDACSPVINYVIELMYASAAFQMKKLVIRLEESARVIPFTGIKSHLVPQRVAFVRFFPSEARVAMEIAGADTATGLSALGQKRLSGNLKEIGLNETPSMQEAKRRQLRLLTLLKTVETGQRYFPHCSEVAELMFRTFYDCSEVVDEFLDCNWSDASLLEKGTPEEHKLRRAYFMKLKVDMQEALRKDVAYHRCLGLPSSWPAFNQYMAGRNQSAFCKNYHGTQILPESLLKEYILADPLLPYTSNVGSIFVCKMFYDLAQLISADNFKSYSSFSNIPRLEWSNRADADATNFYTGLSASKSKGSSGNLKEDCDWSDASLLEKGTPEEQRLKRARFMELKEGVKKAFYKDMAEKIWLREILLEPMLWLCCIIAEELPSLRCCIFPGIWHQLALGHVGKALVEDVLPINSPLALPSHCPN
ncbi:hypothetical protein CUMW_262390, partial [Citrus unshiu]